VTELRVVSYNVHTLRDDQGALRSVVRGLAPDVLILQEAPRRFRWRTRTASLAHDFGLVVAVGGLPALGNLVLTNLRVRVHHSSCLRFPLTPGRHLRGAALAGCSVGASRFAVVGSHLSTDPIERPGQATLLKKAMSELDAPVIVGTDLNESPGGTAWHTVADGLVDSAVAADRAEVQTFSCANPQGRIDALFVDPAIQVRGYDVVDTAETRRASDHFPLVVDLTLPD
jgi:endonuclease/exonuclease/phosphatase family metal-dependent hydrolase